jgi:hypothetical protein
MTQLKKIEKLFDDNKKWHLHRSFFPQQKIKIKTGRIFLCHPVHQDLHCPLLFSLTRGEYERRTWGGGGTNKYRVVQCQQLSKQEGFFFRRNNLEKKKMYYKSEDLRTQHWLVLSFVFKKE